MHSSPRIITLASLVPLLLAGCAQAPSDGSSRKELGACEKLAVSQGGMDLSAHDGTFHLAREPFVIRYLGKEANPALAPSVDNRLIAALKNRGRQYHWGSAGDYVAMDPENLPLLREFELYVDDKSRDQFSSMLGSRYKALLNGLMVDDPGMDTATFIPKAAGGFKRDSATNKYTFHVLKINGIPIERSRISKLYVAYFGTVESYAPPEKRVYDMALLQKLNWGACDFSFGQSN